MTDEPQLPAEMPAKSGRKANATSFKKGYDPRRWLNGRGKKSPEQREGDEILRAVIWEELSREFDTGSMKPLDTPETVDALRLSVRAMLKKRPDVLFDRIAGKITEKHEHTGANGEPLIPTMTPDEIAVKVAALMAKAQERKDNAG